MPINLDKLNSFDAPAKSGIDLDVLNSFDKPTKKKTYKPGDTVANMRIVAAQSKTPIHYGSHDGPGVLDITEREAVAKYGSMEKAAEALSNQGYVAMVRYKGQRGITNNHIHFADPAIADPKEVARLKKQGARQKQIGQLKGKEWQQGYKDGKIPLLALPGAGAYAIGEAVSKVPGIIGKEIDALHQNAQQQQASAPKKPGLVNAIKSAGRTALRDAEGLARPAMEGLALLNQIKVGQDISSPEEYLQQRDKDIQSIRDIGKFGKEMGAGLAKGAVAFPIYAAKHPGEALSQYPVISALTILGGYHGVKRVTKARAAKLTTPQLAEASKALNEHVKANPDTATPAILRANKLLGEELATRKALPTPKPAALGEPIPLRGTVDESYVAPRVQPTTAEAPTVAENAQVAPVSASEVGVIIRDGVKYRNAKPAKAGSSAPGAWEFEYNGQWREVKNLQISFDLDKMQTAVPTPKPVESPTAALPTTEPLAVPEAAPAAPGKVAGDSGGSAVPVESSVYNPAADIAIFKRKLEGAKQVVKSKRGSLDVNPEFDVEFYDAAKRLARHYAETVGGSAGGWVRQLKAEFGDIGVELADSLPRIYAEAQNEVKRQRPAGAIAPKAVTESPAATPSTRVPDMSNPAPKIDTMPDNTFGAKNAATEAARAEIGLNAKVTKRSIGNAQDMLNVGKEAVDSGRVSPDRLVLDLQRDSRPLSDVETSALTYQGRKLQNMRSTLADAIIEADAAGDTAREAKMRTEADYIQRQFDDLTDALQKAGTEWSAAGRARQFLMDNEYSLAHVLKQAQIAKGAEKLTPEEVGKYQELVTKYETATKQLADYEAQKAELQQQLADARKSRPVKVERNPRKPGFGENNTRVTKVQFMEDVAWLREKSAGLSESLSSKRGSVNINPQIDAEFISRAGRVMEYYVEAAGRHSYAELRSFMKQIIPGITDKAIEAIYRNTNDGKRMETAKEMARVRDAEYERYIKEQQQLPVSERTMPAQGPPKLQPDPELYKLRRDAAELRQALDKVVHPISKKQAAKNIALDVLNTGRTLQTTLDVSAPGRQGIMLAAGHPKAFGRAFVNQMKVLFSENNFQALDDMIRGDEHYDLGQQAKLYLAPTEGSARISLREEAFMARLVQKTPVLGSVIRASERAYVGFLNNLRQGVFSEYAKAFGDSITLQDYQEIAKFINAATGRGNLGALEASAPILSQIGYSPRFFMSRIQAPLSLISDSKVARKVAAKNLVAYTGASIAMMAIAKASGAKVETDPRSSDFGKIRVGKTRFDIGAGNLPIIRYTAQLITGERKDTRTGKIKEANRADTLGRFVRSKASPQVGLAWSALKGKDFAGEDVDMSEESLKRQAFNQFLPMSIQDIYDAVKYSGWGVGAAAAPLALSGIGVQSYDNKPKGKRVSPANLGRSLQRKLTPKMPKINM